MSESSPAAGWYSDPRDPWQDRYWDGEAWTTEIRARETPSALPPDSADDHADDPSEYQATESGAAEPANPLFEAPTSDLHERKDDFWAKKDQETRRFVGPIPREWVIGLAALAAALGLLVVFAQLGNDDNADDEPGAVETEPSDQSSQDPDRSLPPIPGSLDGSGSTDVSPTTPDGFTITIPATPTTVSNTLAPAQIVLPKGEGPVGSVDQSAFAPATREVRLSGWAMDADARAPIDVQLTIDGAVVDSMVADARRPDLAPVYRNGVRHGFSFTFVVPAGNHQYCVSGINVGPGPATSQIWCEQRTVE